MLAAVLGAMAWPPLGLDLRELEMALN
jgi:hypothetical protein